MTSKCISKLDRSRHPSSHDHGLQVHLQTRSITASKCISEFNLISASKRIPKLAWSRPPSVSLSSTWSQPPSASLSYSISASKCISKPARSRPPSASLCSTWSQPPSVFLSYSISASKCISKPARLRPPSASLSSTRSRPPSASPNSLDRSLQVHLPVHMITASKCISRFSQSASPGAPAITLQYHLPPDWLYVYI